MGRERSFSSVNGFTQPSPFLRVRTAITYPSAVMLNSFQHPPRRKRCIMTLQNRPCHTTTSLSHDRTVDAETSSA
jgi:hypothetical protein